jgi:rhomboid protease GluP
VEYDSERATIEGDRLHQPSAIKAEEEVPPTPTAWLLVAMWIAVYIAMNISQGGFRSEMGPLGPGIISGEVAHEFGALTAIDVASGQIWRTITATFIHLSLLHLICNLTCLVSFGRILNSWYGGPQFFALYLVIAALGNGFAVAGRYLFKSGLNIPCAGGSSVMFGLIALMAVVGWRSKTRFGDYVRREMVGKLIVFGVIIGLVGRDILDNFGHAGGALAGALVGLSHKQLIRYWDRKPARILGFGFSTLVVAACLVCQWRVGRVEYQAQRVRESQEQLAAKVKRAVLVRLWGELIDRITIRYNQMGQIILNGRGPYRSDPTRPFRLDIKSALSQLDNLRGEATPGGDESRYHQWHDLAESAIKTQPNAEEIREFQKFSRSLLSALLEESKQLPKIEIKVAPKAERAR